MQPNSIDIKEQLAETRRTQIVLGAAQVFAEKGYHRATTREIAQAAGISEGTIYNYFDSKRDLLVAMVELIAIRSVETLLIDHPPDDPRELFRAMLQDRHRLMQEQGYIIAPLLAEIFADAELREVLYRQLALPFTRHLEQYIQKHMDTGQFRQLNPILVTRAFIGVFLINFALKESGLDPRYAEISIETMIETLLTLLLDGLQKKEH